MKKIISVLITSIVLMQVVPVQAHGFYGGGWHGGGFHGGWGRGPGWVPFALGAAVIGGTAAVIANSVPRVYVNPVPAPVYAAPPPVHYYCPAYQAFYPQVPSCPTQWQLVQ